MENLRGRRFARLLVLNLVEGHQGLWHCVCDCGKEVDVYASLLVTGHTKSCGCLNKENQKELSQYSITHHKTNTRIYSVWCGIKDRCNNPNASHYERYGGRGITVCEDWNNSFQSFYDWAIQAGYDERLSGKKQTIDRINVNKGYSPDNCRWISPKEQGRNKENTVYLIDDGKKITAIEFCEKYNIVDTKYVRRKIKKGQTAEEILFDWNILNNKLDEYYTTNEAAKYYNVSAQSVRKWYWSGKLKGIVSGQRLYIPKGQIIEKRKDRDNLGRFLPGHIYRK